MLDAGKGTAHQNVMPHSRFCSCPRCPETPERLGVRPAVAQRLFGAPALARRPPQPSAGRRLTAAERHDEARLARIGRTPVLERTAADFAFEDAFDLGEGYPAAVADAIAGLLAGVRAAERRAGRDLIPSFRVETARLRPSVADAVRLALRRGLER